MSKPFLSFMDKLRILSRLPGNNAAMIDSGEKAVMELSREYDRHMEVVSTITGRFDDEVWRVVEQRFKPSKIEAVRASLVGQS